MSFIEPITEEKADPELREIFRSVRQIFGFLPNYFPAVGRSLPFTQLQMPLAQAVMGDEDLTRAQKEQIGLVVSGINTSSYCVALHIEMLRTLGIEKPVGRKLATNYASAPVESRMQPLFRFADKLTRRPDDIERVDVQAVLDAGWNEQVLFETVLVVAYYNFLNRISIGLGLVADF